MINDQLFTNKINTFVAKIVELIPPQIDLTDDLYLDGWLYADIIVNPEFMSIPLKASLKSDLGVWPDTCSVTLPKYTTHNNKKYPSQIFISTCLINEALYSLYTTNIVFEISNPAITAGKLALLLGNKIERKYGSDTPCNISVALNDTAPTLKTNADQDAYDFLGYIDLNFTCSNS